MHLAVVSLGWAWWWRGPGWACPTLKERLDSLVAFLLKAELQASISIYNFLHYFCQIHEVESAIPVCSAIEKFFFYYLFFVVKKMLFKIFGLSNCVPCFVNCQFIPIVKRAHSE